MSRAPTDTDVEGGMERPRAVVGISTAGRVVVGAAVEAGRVAAAEAAEVDMAAGKSETRLLSPEDCVGSRREM